MPTIMMPFHLELGTSEQHKLQLPDAEIQFFPAFLSETEADHYYQALIRDTPWQQDSLNFGGKTVRIPRLQAWYGDTGSQYGYSGLSLSPLPWTDTLSALKRTIESISKTTFNSVLLNYYRDGQDSVAWHSDNEKELGANPVIASLSLGTSRRFEMKHLHKKRTKSSCDLSHGSLLIMGKGMQQHWQHQVPKQKEICTGRINLTFRQIMP